MVCVYIFCDCTVLAVVTVITNRAEDESERKEAQKCPLLRDEKEIVIRGRQRQRDTVKHVNEKENEVVDEDSEAEKMSPLLQKEKPNVGRSATLALHMDDVLDHIDDHEDDIDNNESKLTVRDKNGKYGKRFLLTNFKLVLTHCYTRTR